MTDAMFFLSAKIREFHFYKFIVEMSLGMVLDAETSGYPAMIWG
jgi:hypothetical protein